MLIYNNWSLTMDAFGPLLCDALISNRLKCKWSDLADKLSCGTVPLPLLSAIHAKVKEHAKDFHEWVEFSPFEVSIPKYGAAIEMKTFGSEFCGGEVIKKIKELPLYQIMAICGSAFTATFNELQSDGLCCSSQKIETKAMTLNTDHVPDTEDDEVLDKIDGPYSNPEPDMKNVSPSKLQTFADNFAFLPSSNMQSKCINESLQMNTSDSQIYLTSTEIPNKEQNMQKQHLYYLKRFKNMNLNTNYKAELTDTTPDYDVLECFGGKHDRRQGLSDKNSTSLSKNKKRSANIESIGSQRTDDMGLTHSEQGRDALECFGGNQDCVQGRYNTNNVNLSINKIGSEKNQPVGSKRKDDMNEANAEQGCDVLECCGSNVNGEANIQTIPGNTTPSLKENPISESIEIQNELESMLKTIITVREESGLESENELMNNVHTPMLSNFNQKQADELDGNRMFRYVKNLAIKPFTKSRKYRAGFVNNFLRKVVFDGRESLSDANPFFENYLKNDLDKLCLIDAGLAFNSPYPLLFQPGRDVDLILSFDFTDRKKDQNMPFKELLKAEEWAKTHNIKFPEVKDNISKYENDEVRELYIFEDETDMECPTIMHFVLVNKDFRKYTAPGVTRGCSKKELKFADFNIYDDQKTFNCMNFCYTSDNFDRLSQLAEFIVLNNLQTIKEHIKKSITHKIGRTRKRHPTR